MGYSNAESGSVGRERRTVSAKKTNTENNERRSILEYDG